MMEFTLGILRKFPCVSAVTMAKPRKSTSPVVQQIDAGADDARRANVIIGFAGGFRPVKPTCNMRTVAKRRCFCFAATAKRVGCFLRQRTPFFINIAIAFGDDDLFRKGNAAGNNVWTVFQNADTRFFFLHVCF
ncbi:hypothetical protein SDC9_128231 [bioreactor metagenome]|uniref:Uncharacterized protein n=1 Tax=bioreactor metagenome TaxID=1076179 RepID=A0A645CW92_9ZZZZ